MAALAAAASFMVEVDALRRTAAADDVQILCGGGKGDLNGCVVPIFLACTRAHESRAFYNLAGRSSGEPMR